MKTNRKYVFGEGGNTPYISYRCGFDTTPDTQFGWGGARNRSDRVTRHLTLEQAIELEEASVFAFRRGLWLNRFLSIHYKKLGVDDCDAVKVTGKFLRLARDWLCSRGHEFACLWVREMDRKSGSHIHILLHVHPEIAQEFVRRQLGWLRKATGLAYKSKVILTRRIGFYSHAATANPIHYLKNLRNVIRYLSKGVHAEAAKILHLNRVDQMAPLIGKRAGTSQNIGRAARERFVRQLALVKAQEEIIQQAFAPQLPLIPRPIGWQRQFEVHPQHWPVAKRLTIQRCLATPLILQLPIGFSDAVRLCWPFVSRQTCPAKRSNILLSKPPRTARHIKFRSNLSRCGHANELLFGEPRPASGERKRQPMNALLEFHTGPFLVHVGWPLLTRYITGPPD